MPGGLSARSARGDQADAGTRGGRARSKRRALALAAIRETFEETGLLLGSKRDVRARRRPPSRRTAPFAEANIPPRSLHRVFHRPCHHPAPRKRRYDYPFLHRSTRQGHRSTRSRARSAPEAELIELVWLPLEDIKGKIELLAITEIVLLDLHKQIAALLSVTTPCRYSFYRVRHGKRVRNWPAPSLFLDFRSGQQ